MLVGLEPVKYLKYRFPVLGCDSHSVILYAINARFASFFAGYTYQTGPGLVKVLDRIIQQIRKNLVYLPGVAPAGRQF